MRFHHVLAAGLLGLALVASAPAQYRRPPADPYPDNPPPAPSRSYAEDRHLWAYGPEGQWSFRQLSNGSWAENNYNGTFYFEETRRTPDYVELSDRDRGFVARLYDDRAYSHGPGEPWKMIYRGHWER
jgi:hypothetical protein